MMATIREGEWTLRADSGPTILPSPIWELRQIRIGPAPGDASYDAHESRTRGSSFVWGDEWRFGEDGRLLSLIWTVPERRAPVPAELGPVEPAALRFEALGRLPTFTETIAFDSRQLVCGREAPPRSPRSFLIAPDLSVVADGDAWWGWRLERPLAHLPEGPGPRALAPLISRWFELVNEETIEALESGDPSLQQNIESLLAEAEALRHPAAHPLAEEAARVLDNFYG